MGRAAGGVASIGGGGQKRQQPPPFSNLDLAMSGEGANRQPRTWYEVYMQAVVSKSKAVNGLREGRPEPHRSHVYPVELTPPVTMEDYLSVMDREHGGAITGVSRFQVRATRLRTALRLSIHSLHHLPLRT